jgi:predicted metalloprotease with PDZ domain
MGLYHSFALCVAPEGKLTDGVEHLFAHELFHTWNGRMLRAEDPQELVYWFVEGFTDYYALRILYESGRWTPAVYAKWTNRHLREYAANPAQNATNDAIKAGFWTERDTVGEVAYQRGLLLGLRWHKLAREHDVADGVDRLFTALVERGRDDGHRLSNEVIRKAGGELLGAWFLPEFDRYVVDAATVDVPADGLAPDFAGKVKAVYEYVLGFDRERTLAEQRVRGLVAGTPAATAGLAEGDELAGWTIPGDADKKVELKVRREGKVKTITYFPRGARTEVLQFTPAKP